MQRALIVGSEILGLTGAHNDVRAMSEVLKGLEFDVDLRMGGDATREGILEGYRR